MSGGGRLEVILGVLERGQRWVGFAEVRTRPAVYLLGVGASAVGSLLEEKSGACMLVASRLWA